MRRALPLQCCLLAAIALTVFCVPSWAQGNLRTVLFVKVKLGQEGNWKAAVKDYAATVKKAGSEQGFTVWESESGPDLHAVVWYSTKWKEMGEQNPKLKPVEADMARLFQRLDGVTDSLGKMDDLKAMFRDTIVPAIKKGGATDYGVAVARYGTPSNEIHSYLGLSGWGDLDGPIGSEKGMSAAEYKAFQAKLAPLIESTEWSIWKYEPELSYVVASK
jgi:hypothetical protein